MASFCCCFFFFFNSKLEYTATINCECMKNISKCSSSKLWFICRKSEKSSNFLEKLKIYSDLGSLRLTFMVHSPSSSPFTNQEEETRTNCCNNIKNEMEEGWFEEKIVCSRGRARVVVVTPEMAIKRWNPIVLLLPLCSSTHSK